MKIIYLLLFVVLFQLSSSAQGTWTVQLAKKTVLKTAKEDTTANKITVQSGNRQSLSITYREPKRKDWSRSLLVFDGADNELLNKEEWSLTLTAYQLRQWSKKTAVLYVYTLPVSLNPSIAVRLRRVHLCTINLR